jgi:hypothetical protein
MSILVNTLGVAAILFYCVLIMWGIGQVWHISKSIQFSVRYLIVAMTVAALSLGLVSALFR